MQFQLITPEKIFYSGNITEVVVPGEDGEFGVLEGHAPTISTLKPGVVTIQTSEGETHKVAVLGGVAEAISERCSVLAEVAKSLDDVSREDLQAELDEANSKLAAANDDDIQPAAREVAMIEAALLAV